MLVVCVPLWRFYLRMSVMRISLPTSSNGISHLIWWSISSFCVGVNGVVVVILVGFPAGLSPFSMTSTLQVSTTSRSIPGRPRFGVPRLGHYCSTL